MLITGATGSVGRRLVADLITQTDWNLGLLVRDIAQARSLWGDHPRLQYVIGDVCQPALGLPLEEQRILSRSVHTVIHAAATTRFDLPLDQARAINVGGTESVLQLAGRFDVLERVAVLSTVYVSGRRTGAILETERSHHAGFVNTYEQSKFEAEAVVESMWHELPCAIYRLSTVIGDSVTGAVNHFTAPHQALRLMYLGLASLLPGESTGPVDLIPVDVASHTLSILLTSSFQPRSVYHIVAGPERSYTLTELIDASYDAMAHLDPAWAARRYPKPVIVDRETFELFLRSVEETGNPLLRGTLGALQHYAHQLTYPKAFDQTNVIAAYPSYPKEMPHVRTYYDKIVRYCLTTRWGRAVRARAAAHGISS